MFPLPTFNVITIRGRLSRSSLSGRCAREARVVRISAGDINSVELRVWSGVLWGHKHGSQYRTEVTFVIDYVQLEGFSKALSALARGE